jgi:hypothetical protein
MTGRLRPLALGALSTVAAAALLVGPASALGQGSSSRSGEDPSETRALIYYARELMPGGLSLEATAVPVPVPGSELQALMPASVALRSQLPFGGGLALRVRPGAGHLAPLLCFELAREPAR